MKSNLNSICIQRKLNWSANLYIPHSHISQSHNYADEGFPTRSEDAAGSRDPTTSETWEDIPATKVWRRPYCISIEN